MRARQFVTAVLLIFAATRLTAADLVATYKDAFASDNADAKRNAVKALGDKGAGKDEDALPLLIEALNDRQARDAALDALRSRTGLTPEPHRGAGGYPGYPSSDSPAAWSAWLGARKADKEKDAKLKKIEEDAEAAKKADKDKDAKGTEGKTADSAPSDASAAHPVESAPPSDLGKLDRIVFKTGGSLLCYIMDKHVDEAGNLISVRVVHREAGGEEVLAGELIARIEEDIE